jgi:hypothetical protein
MVGREECGEVGVYLLCRLYGSREKTSLDLAGERDDRRGRGGEDANTTPLGARTSVDLLSFCSASPAPAAVD